MAAIDCEVEPAGTRLLVRIRGELTLATAPRVRAVLLKCLADRPDAVVADLTALSVPETTAATVFRVVARHASLWPGVPIVIATPDPALTRLFAGGYDYLLVVPSVEQALTTRPRPRTPSIGDTLLPVGGSPRRARELVAAACARWDLPHLAGPAGVIADELVTNALVHANTMIDLKLTLGRHYLIVAVRDGSPTPPALAAPGDDDPDAPRGLLLVDEMAARWGTLPTADGKIVWATLRM